MEYFILQLGIMSLQACAVICVVLLVRIIFAKIGVPKKYMNILWMLPYLCMVCPWKLEGAFGFWRQPGGYSLKNIQQILRQVQYTLNGQNIDTTQAAGAAGKVQDGMEGITAAGNANFAHTEIGSTAFGNVLEELAQNTTNISAGYVSNADVVRMLLTIGWIVWLVGIIGLLIYSADAHLKLHRKLMCCVNLSENIYLADDIAVPFVLGLWKPRIYLPSNMLMESLEYVIAHERTHIRRRDPWKKMVSFTITCMHWFNPLAWVAFYFFGKDMEMACDEETVLKLGIEHKQEYATALLTLSSGKKLFLGAPLAFDEGDVKGRIKNIVKYKKTWRIISVIAVAVIVVLAVGFMTREAEYVPLSQVEDDIMAVPTKGELVKITMDGETKEFPAGIYFENVAEFLQDMKVEKVSSDLNRAEDRATDVVVELDGVKYNFTADCSSVWCDNGVKPSYSYQVKEPQAVEEFLRNTMGSIAEVTQISTEVPTDTKIIENPIPHELTMEEVIELNNNGTLIEVMVALPFAEELVYTNFELNEHDIYALNYTYSCELEYGGEIYRFSTSYYKPEKVAETEYEAHEMCGIRLTHMNSGDICTFYTDVAPDLREDLEVFLNKTYDIKQYLTFDLPEGTWLGDFTLYVNDIYDGCLILGDFEEQPHSENAAKAWYAPGSIGVVQNMITGDTNIMEFEQGKPVSVRWYSNHSGFITKGEYLDGCEMPAILYEGEFDLFTAAESVEYMEKNKISSEDFDGTSEYWYVFFGEEDSEYIYYVALNQAYFAKEDVIALARSVKFTEQ